MRIALPASILLVSALQSTAHPFRLDSRSPNAAARDDSDSSTKRPRYSVVPVDGGDGGGDSQTVTITHPHTPTTVTHRITDTVIHHKPTTVVAVVPVDGNEEEEIQTEEPPSVTLSVPQSSEPTTSELASPTSHDTPESELPPPSSSSIFSSPSAETTVPSFTSTSSLPPAVDPIPEPTFVAPPPQETKPIDEENDGDVIHVPVPAPSAEPWLPEPELSSSSLWLPESSTTSSLSLKPWEPEPEPEPEPTLPVWTETYDVTPPATTSALDDEEWYQPPVWEEAPAWPEVSSPVQPAPEPVETSSPVQSAPEPVETSSPIATPATPTTLLTVTSSAPALEQFGTPAHDDGLWDPSKYPASVDAAWTWGRVRR